jgi:hypothetical protein
MFLRRRREPRSVLSGEVFSVHLIANLEPSGAVDVNPESQVWGFLGDSSFRDILQKQVLFVAQQSLGPEFDLRRMSFSRGSIDIILTIGAIYYAVYNHKNFRERIELFVSQVTGVVRRFLEKSVRPDTNINVSATWQPGPALAQQQENVGAEVDVRWAFPLLWYVILSHASLLALLIWLLARS